jgi:Raf kinase inhibitor-like YbhB/YbcL family protein
MRLTSSAFREGDLIPAKYTCDGQNASPPLKWEDVPEQAKSLALIMDDPDAPSGLFVHWLLFNIPTDENGLTEGIGTQDGRVGGAVQGRNGFGKVAYGGPCPPSGSHRYFFHLYALDADVSVPPGGTRKELDSAMKAHILAETQLMGHYERKT